MIHMIGLLNQRQTFHWRQTFRAGIFLVYYLAATALAAAQTPTSRAREAPRVIPTYERGAPDPTPPLLDWDRRRWRPVYPYTMLDELTNRRVEKSYRAVY